MSPAIPGSSPKRALVLAQASALSEKQKGPRSAECRPQAQWAVLAPLILLFQEPVEPGRETWRVRISKCQSVVLSRGGASDDDPISRS